MVAVALAATTALAACNAGQSSVFVDTEGEQGFSANAAQVGRPVHVGLAGFEVRGDNTVHIEGVQVLDPPDGLRVEAVRAAQIKPGIGTVGVYEGDLSKFWEPIEPRPIAEASFVPGQVQRWYFLVTLVPERPGMFKTGGIEVAWRAGDSKGRQKFRYLIEVTVPPA